MNIRPQGHTAVMSGRKNPVDDLDYFPTPPWATRAFCRHVLPYVDKRDPATLNVWEPAAGEGHMAEVLKEYFGTVHASDVHDYGCGYATGSFVGAGLALGDLAEYPGGARPDWVVSNPPFNLALLFVLRALEVVMPGGFVAMLLRSVWLESEERHRFFELNPIALFAPFAERVAMTEGRWDPNASTATSYAWFVFQRETAADIVNGALCPEQKTFHTLIIPPGRKLALTRPEDARRFARPVRDAIADHLRTEQPLALDTPPSVDPELASAVQALGSD